MDVQMMETEVILSDFIEFYRTASQQVNATASEADRIPENQLNQMVVGLNVMKTLFVTQLTVKRMLADAGGSE